MSPATPVPENAPMPRAALLCLFALTGTAQAATWMGTVTSVVDGDTVWVQPDQLGPITFTRSGRPRKRPSGAQDIRLLGIDAPEICQAYGPQARQALATLVLHRVVQVQTATKDRYGRTVARVFMNGIDASAWMVGNGHAWAYGQRRSRKRPGYEALQATAQASHSGLFAYGGATEPRLFRQTHGACPHH